MNSDWIGFQIAFKKLRCDKNVTLEQLAGMIGVSKNLIWRLESSEVPPSLKLLKHVCEVFTLDYVAAKKAVYKHKMNLLEKKFK